MNVTVMPSCIYEQNLELLNVYTCTCICLGYLTNLLEVQEQAWILLEVSKQLPYF